MKNIADGMYRILGEGAFEYLAKAQAIEREGKEVLHFEIGQPDFPTPENIKQSAYDSIRDNFTGYVAATGILELKEAIQEEIDYTRGFTPDLDQILILPGAKPGIFFTMLGLVNPGEEIIYPDPGFPTYGSVVKYLDAGNVPIALKEENEFRLNPDDIENKITSKTKLIILNSPQNPTGSVMTQREIERLAELAEKHGIYILSDEIYSKMLYDAEFNSPSVRDESKERTIILDGFSKSYSMTGWRLGYIVGPKPVIEKMGLLMINALSCTTSFVQKAGITALKGDQEPLFEMMRQFRIRRDAIVKGLNSIPNFSCLTPEGAFYTFPNIKKTGMTSREMADHLLYEAGVCCLPGSSFGPSGEGYIRFSYATSVEIIKDAVQKIKESFS
ncbi:MAG: pyridoxal phosphate-dependent aminotransferase [Candidatus Heimdallarchaeota archaeon]|nr:pyridoxal phosphate-dependent aminotransferase [Candidatus Heimdallarchaeota archaeon]MCK4770078.1 pyridoxal phosphate-dependent aminotransferase [Candidatus Heimdallarchaeota archaeon]